MTLDFNTILQEVFPDNDFGGIDPTGDLAKLLAGMAEDYQTIYDRLMLLAHTRDPRLISSDLLPVLEREFGIVTDTSLTEAVRRQMLAHVMFRRPTTASWEHLQNALIDAGFDNLLVTVNNPMADLTTLAASGELLVNGPIYTEQGSAYYMADGSDIAYDGGNRAYDGYYLKDIRTAKTYTIPIGPPYWPRAFIFVVGGAASGWPSSPAVAQANVDSQRETQLKNLILTYKPANTWCILRINWT